MLQEPLVKLSCVISFCPGIVAGVGVNSEFHVLDARALEDVHHALGFLGRHDRIFAAVKGPHPKRFECLPFLALSQQNLIFNPAGHSFPQKFAPFQQSRFPLISVNQLVGQHRLKFFRFQPLDYIY